MSRPVLSLLLMLLALIAPAGARAAAAAGDNRAEAYAAVCEQAALQAAAESGVPPDILTALTLTETGRKLNGRLRPWAWSVNAEGAGSWHDDPQSLLAFAEERVRQGRTNMDLGCFQINYRWHGQHFASVADMLDPLSNARYAARFVRELYQDTGDWRAAAGAFHSRTPHYASKYLARFDQLRAMVNERGLPQAGPHQAVQVAGLAPTRTRPRGTRAAPDLWRSDMAHGISVRAGVGTGRRVAAVDPDIAALDRFVAQANGTSVDALLDSGAAAGPVSDMADGWTGQTPADLPDDPGMDQSPQPDLPSDLPPGLLVGAPVGTMAQGGGSLAALAQGNPALLGDARAPILPGGAQALPGLPDARNGPPASNSSLWQMAALE